MEVVESVTSVEKLSEVLNSHYSTIAVVNLFGSLIGLIPKNFVIVLLENHWWYEEEINEPVFHKAKSYNKSFTH